MCPYPQASSEDLLVYWHPSLSDHPGRKLNPPCLIHFSTNAGIPVDLPHLEWKAL